MHNRVVRLNKNTQLCVKAILRQFGDNVVEPQFVAQMTQAGWGCISFFNTTAKKFQNKKL